MAIRLRRRRRQSDRPDGRHRISVERRVYVNAQPGQVWAALHDPANADALLPEVTNELTAPAWPAAAATRTGRARLGLLREPAVAESLEARPASRFRYRLTGEGFASEWTWTLEPTAGGTRVIHGATFEPADRLTWLFVRLGGSPLDRRVDTHLRELKERAERSARDDAAAEPSGRPPGTPATGS
jgi:carbon monoxide dehydrogenase subunit G